MTDTRFAWTPDLSVGVEAIDAQHRELFDRVSALLSAVASRREADEVFRTLAFLGDYVIAHFEDEERLMQVEGYPDLPQQLAEHAHFHARFNQLCRKFARAGVDATLSVDLRHVVCDWLVHHVRGSDAALGRWLNAREAALEAEAAAPRSK